MLCFRPEQVIIFNDTLEEQSTDLIFDMYIRQTSTEDGIMSQDTFIDFIITKADIMYIDFGYKVSKHIHYLKLS